MWECVLYICVWILYSTNHVHPNPYQYFHNSCYVAPWQQPLSLKTHPGSPQHIWTMLHDYPLLWWTYPYSQLLLFWRFLPTSRSHSKSLLFVAHISPKSFPNSLDPPQRYYIDKKCHHPVLLVKTWTSCYNHQFLPLCPGFHTKNISYGIFLLVQASNAGFVACCLLRN